MAGLSPAESVVTLQTELRYIDTKLTEGVLSPESLVDLKNAVDEVRLRLWGAILADHPADYNAFRQRFRLQRAAEICRGVAADLHIGALPWTHGELQGLADAAATLATSIAAGLRDYLAAHGGRGPLTGQHRDPAGHARQD